MNDTIKVQWIRLLRSGEHRQRKGLLQRKDSEGVEYCALGLCYLAAGLDPAESPKNYSLFKTEAQLTQREESNIVDLNDVVGKSFPEIADWVEANL